MQSYIDAIESGWKEVLKDELQASYFNDLLIFIDVERQIGKTIYPIEKDVFRAFQETPFKDVKVVIIGQDPYHGFRQAHGLAFSVPDGVKIPPSLKNIFKEIQSDLKLAPPVSGNLTSWAKQGVLLLNAVLTVEADKAGSHQKKGWERFTDAAISALSEQHQGLIFLLWGNHAKEKTRLIDAGKHTILLAPHPSPLSAYQGFFGCGHFSKTNLLLSAQGKAEIEWIPKPMTL